MATPLPLGWHTDVAVLAYSGSEVEEHAGHLVVRTPANPTYHWGNFVLVTDPDAVGEAGRWLGVFEAAFPDARHRAIGLCADPPDASAWESLGLEVEHEDVLAGHGPRRTPLANGYVVRPLEGASDWEQDVRLSMGTDRDPAQDVFQRGATAAKARMCAAGVAVFLGAFEGPDLVADLGIVDCGEGIACKSAREDVERRDFTINGLLLDPINHEVLDFVGGRKDLDAGIIRTIGQPELRFAEDKLRMLRAVRFAARFGYAIEPATFAAIQKLAPRGPSSLTRAGARRTDQNAYRGPRP